MHSSNAQKLPPTDPHPYLSGNFAPIRQTRPLTPCTYSGSIPAELAGGQYVRNGGNPLTNDDLGRDAHWFDGDGMLSGVLFRPSGEKGTEISPEFVNQYILTDVYLNAKDNRNLRVPLLPSIATLVNPMASLLSIMLVIMRTCALVFLSHMPNPRQAIKKISVANTSIIWHDGRALATCESGPPMRVLLPSLETVGWFNGRKAENEAVQDSRSGFGGDSAISFMKEWTTGHPRVDPVTKEFISLHSVFIKPYVYYSIVPATKSLSEKAPLMEPAAVFDVPVPGVNAPKMMHDFGVSAKHTIILDLPLSLDPFNIARGVPVVSYDPASKSRFGVFPRYEPTKVQWFETNPCVIFHTANAWDTTSPSGETAVNLLACRLTSASLVYSAGALSVPVPTAPIPPEFTEEEQCRLYYFNFPFTSSSTTPRIKHQWALSAISFEFPTLSANCAMQSARYVYGCSTASASYSAALGKAAKIEYLSKVDVKTLIARGIANPPQQVKGCVDTRSVDEIMRSNDPEDPIQLFEMPEGWYAQEPRFIPRDDARSEDDGWLLTYVFDESQLDQHGIAKFDAASELWIIDAKNMKVVVARIKLPQRVPYGLHGNWFSEEEVEGQRAISGLRTAESDLALKQERRGVWSRLSNTVEEYIG